MALNPYDSCPCGSGKKLKFCCEKYFPKIEQALTLHQQGQHDSALRMMEQVTKEHPNHPPVWGYYANLLNAEGQSDQAEEALGKAFALQPDFPMGFLLQGMFRQQEGEVIGALLLFRKAAEAYD
ncbi:MAG: tetratricopeptide repeat protein, partial [Fimbriiglobus sp.]